MVETDSNLENKLADVTAIIMTNNEEKHIERCLLSIKDTIKKVVIIDSYSTDNTLEIAKKYNITVLQHEWVNYARQFNWGVENSNIETEWVFRMDPDEILSENFKEKIYDYLNKLSLKVSGVSIIRRFIFLGKEINFGGDFPQKGIRIWRNRKGKCEDTWSDEHIIVEGDVDYSNLDIIDKNMNNISWWTDKHNRFATREMIEFFLQKLRSKKAQNLKLSKREKIKKNLKFNIYYKSPYCLRAFLFFLYKYIFRLGLLNGWQGFVFHFLQGFWYRFLVDIKIIELRYIMKKNNLNLHEAIKREYGINL